MWARKTTTRPNLGHPLVNAEITNNPPETRRSMLCPCQEIEAKPREHRLPKRRRLVGFGGGDADEAAAAATIFKLDVAGDEREKRVVLALTHIFTSLMLGAALANQNRAGVDQLSAKALYAEPLSVRIAAVC